MSEENKNMVQSIVITFSDGTVATFSGKVVCQEGDERKITGIHFTLPVELPGDCSWEYTTNDV